MKTVKKLLAVMFALCMLVTLPTMTYAASNITSTGSGTYEDPYLIIYRGAALTGEVVPAGGDVFYYAFADGLIDYTMEIKTEGNIAVQYGRQTLYPENGSILVPVEAYIAGGGGSIGIWNMGDTDATFDIDIYVEQTEQEKGTYDNPDDLSESLYGDKEVAANSDGYYATYTAPATGTLKIDVNAFDAEYNYIGWSYNVNGVQYVDGAEKYYYGDTIDYTMDYDKQTTVIEVNAGDTFTIAAGTLVVETVTENGITYDKYSCPAGLITISITFEYPEGTKENPTSITELEGEYTVPAGGKWFKTTHSGVTLKIEGNVSVVYNGTTYAPVNGVTTIAGLEAGFFEPAKLQFLNDGTEAATVKVSVIYPEGHNNNPKDLVSGTEATVTLEDENYDGYFYDFVVTEDGKITVTAAGNTWAFVVDIHKDGVDEWGNPLVIYGEQVTTYSEDATFTADVVAGDVVVVRVFNYTEEEVRIPMDNGEDFVYTETNAPAGDVSVTLIFAPSVIEGTGDFSSTMLYVIVLLGAALVSAGFVAKKRFA